MAPTEETIRGSITKVTYRNNQTGFVVIRVKIAGSKDPLTVVGNLGLAKVAEGSQIIASGFYDIHPKFGRQLKASSIVDTPPSSPEGIARYLSSNLFKGIGPKTAQRIVEHFGQATIETILNSPERLHEVKGCGKKAIASIIEQIEADRGQHEVMRFLLEHGISVNLSNKIYARYGSSSVAVIRSNPYLLAYDIKGVGFITADNLALHLGIERDAPQRLKAGILYTLERAMDDGHVFLPKDSLFSKAYQLLEIATRVDLAIHLISLTEEGLVVNDSERIYLTYLFRAEDAVASFIADRAGDEIKDPASDRQISNALHSSQRELKVTLSDEQIQAVRAASRRKLVIITGGPGCGKTTVVRAVVNIFRAMRRSFLLTAPTGRAAQRLAQVCSFQASTIHRLLKFDPITRTFNFNESTPLVADAVIVDEMSMVDIMLMRHLIAAIPESATLVLVGDKDQLPSVGPGRVFADLVSLADVKTIVLSQLFRRAQGSSINEIAYMVNAGKTPNIPTPDGATRSDAYFLDKRDPQEMAELIESLVAEQLPKKFGLAPEDIMVLTPTNRGPVGTVALNLRLQQKLNPESTASGGTIKVGESEFRAGDRVCQRVNNYQIDEHGVFNGDNGRIVAINANERLLTVELWDGRLIKYKGNDLQQLSHAYAMTVHRSQGTEIPCVVLALHDSHYILLERQLLYTGITRAKKLLIFVGTKRALNMAVRNTESSTRFSYLRERFKMRFRPATTGAEE